MCTDLRVSTISACYMYTYTYRKYGMKDTVNISIKLT